MNQQGTAQLTKQRAKVVYADIVAALRPVAEKHGMTLTAKGGLLTEWELKPRLTFVLKHGTDEGPEVDAFRQLAEVYQLKVEWLGQRFEHNGTSYVVGGLLPKRVKFPVLGISDAGKQMLFTVNAIRRRFGMPDAAC